VAVNFLLASPVSRRNLAQAAGGDKTMEPPVKIGLADQIMAANIAEAASKEQAATKGSEQPGADQEGKSEKSGPQPMPKWQKYSYIALGVLMGGSLVGNAILFSLPDKDEQGNNIEDEYSSLPFPSQHYNRLKNKIFSTKKAIEEPFSDKLLPDPLEPPYYQPKYTVVLGAVFCTDFGYFCLPYYLLPVLFPVIFHNHTMVLFGKLPVR
jgi:import inner membrane translocase subunit TIM50